MSTPKLLELFAGSRSVGKVAERRGWRVFSVDLKPFRGIDLVADINTINVRHVPFIPDCIWASPPCTTFSVASVWRYWTPDGTPRRAGTLAGIRLIVNTLHVIRYFALVNPRLVFYIENPRGMLRKTPLLSAVPRATVFYCKYGDTRMKPTDIWTNNLRSHSNPRGWRPRGPCFPNNPDCHHEQCASNEKCGTLGLRNAYERSKIPAALARECLDAAINGKIRKNPYFGDFGQID